MASGHAIKRKTDVRVTDTAARDLHDDLIRAGAEGGELANVQRLIGGR